MRRLIPFLLAAIAGAAIALGVAAIADSGVEPVASIDADDLFEGSAFWSRLDHVQQVELVQLCRREISTQNTFGAAGPDPVDAYDVADLLAYVNAVLARAPDDVEGEQNAGGDAASVLDACAAAAERLRILGGPPRNDERSLLITNREWPRLAETASDPGWAGLHLRVAGQVARPEGSRPRAVVLKPGDSVAGPAVIGLTEVPDSIADGDYVEVSGRIAGTDGCPPLDEGTSATCEVLVDKPRLRKLEPRRALALMDVEIAVAPLDAETAIPGFELDLELARWYRDTFEILLSVRRVADGSESLTIEDAELVTGVGDVFEASELLAASELDGAELVPGTADTRLLVFKPTLSIEHQELRLELTVIEPSRQTRTAELDAVLRPRRTNP